LNWLDRLLRPLLLVCQYRDGVYMAHWFQIIPFSLKSRIGPFELQKHLWDSKGSIYSLASEFKEGRRSNSSVLFAGSMEFLVFRIVSGK
jgi:hypothetical protein